MNRYISDDIIEEVRNRCNIVDIINSYAPLKKTGSTWKTLCPFHQEKTPSFVVTPERQIFHCFGCGKGGDVFRFIMDREGVDFPTAVHLLADRCGVLIPESAPRAGESPQQARENAENRANRRDRLYQLHEKLCTWFEKNLKRDECRQVAEYLQSRELPPEIVAKFRLGAAQDSWDAGMNWCRMEKFTDEELLLAGIVLQSEQDKSRLYDRFRNRLIFPIWNETGKVVAFSARTIEANPQGAKYVNSPETPVFRKSRILYALPLARQAIQQMDYVILCEGQLDVIAMHRAGYENTVAPQGTAFTEEQANMLKRYANRICLAFDSDGAGIKAAMRAVEILLPLDFEVSVIQFPEGRDPDDILRKDGLEKLQGFVSGARDFYHFILDQCKKNHNVANPTGKGRIVGEMVSFISKVSNAAARTSYASQLSLELNIPEQAVFSELNKIRRDNKFRNRRRDNNRQDDTQAPAATQFIDNGNELTRNAEETLLELAITHGTVGQRLSAELPSEMISESPVGKALEVVIQLTVNGEWEHTVTQLSNMLRENPNPTLSRILATKSEYDHKTQEKAVDDCMKVIKRHHLQEEMDKVRAEISSCADADAKRELMKKYQEIFNKTRQLDQAQGASLD